MGGRAPSNAATGNRDISSLSPASVSLADTASAAERDGEEIDTAAGTYALLAAYLALCRYKLWSLSEPVLRASQRHLQLEEERRLYAASSVHLWRALFRKRGH